MALVQLAAEVLSLFVVVSLLGELPLLLYAVPLLPFSLVPAVLRASLPRGAAAPPDVVPPAAADVEPQLLSVSWTPPHAHSVSSPPPMKNVLKTNYRVMKLRKYLYVYM